MAIVTFSKLILSDTEFEHNGSNIQYAYRSNGIEEYLLIFQMKTSIRCKQNQQNRN